MSTLSIALSASCLILILLLSLSVYFNIKHGILLIRVQEALEKSLDILDLQYKSISGVLEIPIFFDSVEVRQVVSDMKRCQNAVLKVANTLTSDLDSESEKEELLDD
ncbi:hypothetical protein CL634_08015 [bacterium]|nr:hypothetical protein [bacterium]